ncbi:FAD-containing oxidoreductase [Blastopirellula marina]|uniref:FAD-containing oxidoreductase n=1 Tax=Blastopirellula marina TaxID=124 RepID=A0A2S8FM72_9BACT|nr:MULTISPECIES: mercuric reductase [Pirellulaceae]PQO33237.1 FAD-containing oxidoreductase [Blastopirellula marina]RCS52326.1 mercuric reductase [Bremerella cremea]
MAPQDRPQSFPDGVISRLPQTSPNDSANRRLVENVHPADWKPPQPSGRYNLVVIGAGTAGLVAAAGAAGLGAKVALIERDLMGGDCLNVGCVPSKGIISAARMVLQQRRGSEFGINTSAHEAIDFAAVMQRMRTLRAEISPNDSAERFCKLGVDVYFGQAQFVDSQTVQVDGQRLKFKKAVIATGARAAIPSIAGLDRVDYLTNESVFSLTKLPPRLGVVGSGPIGCELAQAFSLLGSQVTLLGRSPHVLPKEDADASTIVAKAMTRDGVRIHNGTSNLQVKPGEAISLTWSENEISHQADVDQLLFATGRRPNVEHLNLEAVGVHYNEQGVQVNDRLQTTNRNIFAAGDICSPYQFTHAADFMARAVIQNALFFGRKRWTDLIIPWCTYTSPEVAHVGLSEHQAKEQGRGIDTYSQHFTENDRAILAGETEGLVKVHVKKNTDKIVGATIVAPHAGEMISEITLAMTHGLGLGKIGSTIHPYPTQTEAIRKLGDQYNRTRLTPFVKSLFERWLTWSR